MKITVEPKIAASFEFPLGVLAVRFAAEVETNLANARAVLFNLACSISRLSIIPPVFPGSACTVGIESI